LALVSADATLTSSETTSDSSFDFFSSFGLDSFDDDDAARLDVEADVAVDDDDKAGNVSEENGDCVELFSTFDLSS
jgi:hypothetical protein